MTIYLKQSTASQEVPLGPFLDSTDGNTQETGLSIANTDIKVWKTGATTLANKNSGGATHIANGRYYCVLDATDTDTLGPLVIFIHVTGSLAVRLECVVLAANVYDSLIGGGDTLDVQVTGMGSGVLTATAIASDAITAAKVASDVTTEIQSGLATAANLATVAGYLDTEIAAILEDTGTTIPAQITALNNLSAAQVNAEVVDALATDTYAEPGQGAPAATASLSAKINYLYKAWRNKKTQTSTTFSLFADDASTVDQKSTISDDSTTFTSGEIASGP